MRNFLNILATFFLTASVAIFSVVFTGVFAGLDTKEKESGNVLGGYGVYTDKQSLDLQNLPQPTTSSLNNLSPTNTTTNTSTTIVSPVSSSSSSSSSTSNTSNQFAGIFSWIEYPTRLLIIPQTYFQEDAQFYKDLSVDGDGNVDGDLAVGGSFRVGDNSTFEGDVTIDGDQIEINGVQYSWPDDQSSGVLTNDGDGNLSWSTAGVDNFLGLTDTPDAYTGSSNYLVAVNAAGTALEFINPAATVSGVGSVSNNDGTLTISPNTGVVIASLNLANANSWSGAQTFTANTFFPGSGIWNTSGQVGIGTVTPGMPLDVVGGIRTSDDFYVNGIGLNDVSGSELTSGASRIGTFDEFANSNSLNVQDVLDDLDFAITGATHNPVTLAGTLDYITINGSQVITRNAIDLTTDVSGILPLSNGGTGLNITGSSITDGQLLIGNNSADGFSVAALTSGTGILVTNGSGSISIANTDPGSAQNIFKNIAVSGQGTVVTDNNNDTLTLVAGTNITLTTDASTDSITINSTGGGGGGSLSGTDNRLARFNAAGDNVEDSSINDEFTGGVQVTIDPAARVGIGVTAPTATVDIQAQAGSLRLDTNDSITINSDGIGYTDGDVLTLAGGNGGQVKLLHVSGVSEGGTLGRVIEFAVIKPGYGYSTGTNVATTGGTGSGATFDINVLDNEPTLQFLGTGNPDELNQVYEAISIRPTDTTTDSGTGMYISSSTGNTQSGRLQIGTPTVYDMTPGAVGSIQNSDLTFTEGTIVNGSFAQSPSATLRIGTILGADIATQYPGGAFAGTMSINGGGVADQWDGSSFVQMTTPGTMTIAGSGFDGANWFGGDLTLRAGFGTDVSGFVKIMDPVTNANAALDASLLSGDKTFIFPDASGTFALGTGTANYIPIWNDSNTLGISEIYQDGLHIGIGTTAPIFKLDVAGVTRTWDLVTQDISLSSLSTSLISAQYGFNGYTNFSGGIGTGGNTKDSIFGAQRLTSTGNLTNIGSIQAGETTITGGGTFASDVTYTTGTTPYRVAMGDLNGDGKVDTAVVNQDSDTVSVFINNGDGTFAAAVDYTTEDGPRGVAIGDLNGDGKVDIAVTTVTTSALSIFINNGDGTFAAKVDYATDNAPQTVSIADFNGDGRADIVTDEGNSDEISVFLNNGDGTFAVRVDYPAEFAPSYTAAGDLNGDGKADIAEISPTGQVSVYINNGDGTFAARVNYPTGTLAQAVGIGDLNGDGKADLAVSNQGDDTVSVLINNGDGTFAAKVDYPAGDGPTGIAIGDVNGDGKADLAASNFTDDTVSILVNNGDGTFAANVDYSVGDGPNSIAIGDLNSDGRVDLAVADSNTTTMSILMNNASPILFAQASTGNVGIGTTAPTSKLHVVTDSATDYAAYFFNDGDATDRQGIAIQAGLDTGAGTNNLVTFFDGDGTQVGEITNNNGTVGYAVFTGVHNASLPEKDNENGYAYGTMVCLDQTTTPEGSFQPEYKVSKCSGLNASNIFGIYASKDTSKPNQHQIFAVGDGHVLVTAENGEIKKGDSIVSSSKPGYGMKATEPGTIIGTATADWTELSDSTTVTLSNGTKVQAGLMPVFYYPGMYYSGNQNNLSAIDTNSVDMNALAQKVGRVLEIKTEDGVDKSIFYSSMNVTGNVTADSFSTLGKITSGFLTIDGTDNSISIIGGEDLKLQNGINPGNIDAFNGELVLTSNGGIIAKGSIEAKTVAAENFAVLSAQDSNADSSVGEGTISAGQTEVKISNSNVNSMSKVFVTPNTDTNDNSLIVSEKSDGSFTVKIKKAFSDDIKFDYWIVGVKEHSIIEPKEASESASNGTGD